MQKPLCYNQSQYQMISSMEVFFMAFDGLAISNLVYDFDRLLTGGRINTGLRQLRSHKTSYKIAGSRLNSGFLV